MISVSFSNVQGKIIYTFINNISVWWNIIFFIHKISGRRVWKGVIRIRISKKNSQHNDVGLSYETLLIISHKGREDCRNKAKLTPLVNLYNATQFLVTEITWLTDLWCQNHGITDPMTSKSWNNRPMRSKSWNNINFWVYKHLKRHIWNYSYIVT
jgi:hypothetical protein